MNLSELEPLEPRVHLTAVGVFSDTATVLPIGRQNGNDVQQAVVADFDGDGLNDIAVIYGKEVAHVLGGSERRVAFLRGQPDGTFSAPVVTDLGAEVFSITAGHFSASHTGAADLAALGWYGGGDSAPMRGYVLRVLRYDSSTGGLAVVARQKIPFTVYRAQMEVGNVTGGASEEIVLKLRGTVPGDSGSPLQVFVGVFGVAAGSGGSGADSIVLKTTVKSETYPHNLNLFGRDLSLADLDGDGTKEIILYPLVQWKAWYRARAGVAPHIGLLSGGTALGDPVIYTDIDGDGKADRVWTVVTGTGPSNTEVFVALGSGDGTFQNATMVAQATVPGSPSHYSVTSLISPTSVLDLDGDGRLDFMLCWQEFGYFGGEDAGFATVASAGAPTGYTAGTPDATRVLALGDLNNDGLPDLLFIGSDGSLSVRLNVST